MYCLSDYIRVYDIHLPDTFVDTLLSRYKDCFTPALTVGEKFNDDTTIGTIRRCTVSPITDVEQRLEESSDIDTLLFNQFTTVLQRYHNEFPLMYCTQDTGYQLLQYEAGGFYKQHVDQTPEYPHRTVSAAILLNDDFEGGQFSFFDRTYIPPLTKHQCIVFPSNFMFPHEITPITKGTRYSVVTWFH